MDARPVGSEAQAEPGTTWLRNWLFGKRDYAHPALRWAATPMLRAAIVLAVLSVVVGGGFIPLWIAAGAVLVVSVSASTVNALMMRARGRRPEAS